MKLMNVQILLEKLDYNADSCFIHITIITLVFEALNIDRNSITLIIIFIKINEIFVAICRGPEYPNMKFFLV